MLTNYYSPNTRTKFKNSWNNTGLLIICIIVLFCIPKNTKAQVVLDDFSSDCIMSNYNFYSVFGGARNNYSINNGTFDAKPGQATSAYIRNCGEKLSNVGDKICTDVIFTNFIGSVGLYISSSVTGGGSADLEIRLDVQDPGKLKITGQSDISVVSSGAPSGSSRDNLAGTNNICIEVVAINGSSLSLTVTAMGPNFATITTTVPFPARDAYFGLVAFGDQSTHDNLTYTGTAGAGCDCGMKDVCQPPFFFVNDNFCTLDGTIHNDGAGFFSGGGFVLSDKDCCTYISTDGITFDLFDGPNISLPAYDPTQSIVLYAYNAECPVSTAESKETKELKSMSNDIITSDTIKLVTRPVIDCDQERIPGPTFCTLSDFPSGECPEGFYEHFGVCVPNATRVLADNQDFECPEIPFETFEGVLLSFIDCSAAVFEESRCPAGMTPRHEYVSGPFDNPTSWEVYCVPDCSQITCLECPKININDGIYPPEPNVTSGAPTWNEAFQKCECENFDRGFGFTSENTGTQKIDQERSPTNGSSKQVKPKELKSMDGCDCPPGTEVIEVTVLNTFGRNVLVETCGVKSSNCGSPIAEDDISVTDPCSCDNPRNVELADRRLLFNDTIKVVSTTGPVFLAATDGNLLDASGNPLPAITTTFTQNASTGDYELEVFTANTVSAAIEISNGVASTPFTVGPCFRCEPIPTMGEWGLISLGLLLMIFGVQTIKEKRVLEIWT